MDSTVVSSDDAPLSERLKFGTNLHNEVLRRVNLMVDAAKEHIDQRSADWERVDRSMRMYTDFTSKYRKSDKQDTTKDEQPFEKGIVIPLTYANIMSRQVQKFAIMTANDPIVHLEGRGGEDWQQARIHEAVIRWDNEVSLAPLTLWQACFDDERYGFCVIHDTWEEEHGWVFDKPEVDPVLLEYLPEDLQQLAKPKKNWKLRKEYVKWTAISPRKYLPDPSVPIWNPQAGQFVGHRDSVSWLKLHAAQKPDGPYFNVEEARQLRGEHEHDDDDMMLGSTGELDRDDAHEGSYPVGELASVQVKIIPKEWQLSSVERQEIWNLAVWNGRVIVRAHPQIYHKDEYRYSVGVGDLDQHAPFVPGMGEQVGDLQQLVNWLTGSHVTNVIKILNDSLIYDPSLVNERDLLQPGPTRHVRLTKHGQQLLRRGFAINQMYGQLQVGDVTSHHLELAQQLLGFAQRVSAANDAQQGQLFSEKHTLGEVKDVNQAANARIGTAAQLIDHMCIGPVARRHVSARQQLTSQEQYIRIAGDLVHQLGGDAIMVRPGDLYGDYDYIPHTPTMAPDPARQAAAWMSLLQLLASAPHLLAPRPDGKQLDPHKLFNEAVRSQGINYFEQFYMRNQAPPVPPRIMPDDQVAAGVKAGNLAPMQAPQMPAPSAPMMGV